VNLGAWVQRVLRPLAVWLASVTAVPVGREGDGLTRSLFSSGTEIDKPWGELAQELSDAREAWRKNPMARRVINIITSYVVGPGMAATSEYRPLAKFIDGFWHHDQNLLDLHLDGWCDELSRGGELFLVLFTNEYDGMSYVRAIPASQIEEVRWRDGDYQTELRYRQSTGPGEDERWWYAPAGAPEGWTGPVMLHYAVNRPVGAVRGESDLAPILPWLRRYTRWLEDRVRLNAAVRAFLWVVRAPQRLTADLRETYRTPPEAGSVIVAQQDEEWEAVAPNLQARDANADGRAIRWMIAAGGPGTSLVDFGEGEDANLATARASAEVRRRFLTQRQGYFAYLLADLIVQAFHRYVAINSLKHRRVNVADVVVAKPDIAADDNEALAKAALALTEGLTELRSLIGDSGHFKRFALRLFVKFLGESITEREFDSLIAEKFEV
jgi:hypothetical protein